MKLRLIVCTLLALPLLVQGAGRSAAARRWEASVVTLEVSSKQYNFMQPWWRGTQTVLKPGVILPDHAILTTAFGLANRTVARAQAGGRGPWYEARVTWVDYGANLALLTVDDPIFWEGRRPAKFSKTIPDDGELQVVRWRGGSLELRQAEFNRFTVTNPSGGDAAHVVLEVNSEIDGTGWGEPLVASGRLVGLVIAAQGNLCQVLPVPFIRSILEAQHRDAYHGMGYFDFTWQPTINPDTLEYLRLPTTDQGVIIIDVPRHSPTAEVLKPRDVILEVDGFPIDNEGDYEDPLYGHLMLEALSTRNRWVGDRIPLKIWRDGAPRTVEYTLPSIRDAARLVPEAPIDEPPRYLIVGGFIFQPLTRNYLRSWGPNWENSAPFRLAYFRNEEPTSERPAVVILSSVLPDPLNLGYQDVNQLILEKVNGRRVSSLQELQEALSRDNQGFYLFEFLAGESVQRMVLDASQVNSATARILERYGIDSASEVP